MASKTDASLFMYHSEGVIAYLLVYVDDIILTGNDSSHLCILISKLGKEFALKDLGPLRFFLGIELTPNDTGLLLTQQKYIFDLLNRSHMEGSKPLSTPLSSTTRLSRSSGTPLTDPSEYRSIVGALQYVTLTRPDISFAVNKVCQFMAVPTDEHWLVVKGILRYLKGTISMGLQLRSSSSLTLSAFSDADWASCPNDRKSTGGYLIFLGNNLVSWQSRKQNIIARSSTESEYRALALATTELTRLQSLLR
ncbi:uncharacterized mitochondrial protein AtMg00810-like [Telopea speciosissima]|uniref:uncharacterized mitochondrial protein AtMg00810-like n=1 Tax=Telopea speciosissima TaxID=54955 RepID=UPI001CC73073|nr:uncharacterized mitochondrial protein AtMg00810-like [Telopea speciosissima]